MAHFLLNTPNRRYKFAVHIRARKKKPKIALVRSYLRVPQAAGQVKILIFLVKINLFPMYTNISVMQGKCLF